MARSALIGASIRRPVALTTAYFTLAVLGAFSGRNLPLELVPDADLPRLVVSGVWPGASPETVEAFLTSPLEATIQQAKGVETLTSTSSASQGTGRAEVQVRFGRDVDMNVARLDLSERIAALQGNLPSGAGQIRVQPYVPAALSEPARGFLTYQVAGPYTAEALRAHVDQVVVPALAEIDGVGFLNVYGGRRRLLQVRVDPVLARSLGLTPPLLERRIGALDLVQEAGVVEEEGRNWTVTIADRPDSAPDLRDAIVGRAGDRPVRVRDVARIRDAYEEPSGFQRIDAQPAVTLEIGREGGTNTLAVADRVKEAMTRVERYAPRGTRYLLMNDESAVIRRQLSDQRRRAAGSVLVISFVLFAFLRSMASATVVLATLAFSVLIAVIPIYVGGLSLNLLTMMGLAMGFGPIVDHAIVVIENIHRRRQAGEAPEPAAGEGAREVALPLITSVATNLVVLLPFVYLQGELRVYYVPLALVAGFSQIASLLVSFTLVPGLAARLLRGPTRGRAAGAPRRPRYAHFYAALVGWTLRRPRITVSAALGLFAVSSFLFGRYVTRGAHWGGAGETATHVDVLIRLPRGSALGQTDELVRFFEERIERMEGVETFSSSGESEFAQIRIEFPDSLERTAIPAAVEEAMEGYSHGITGADVRVYGRGPSFGGGGAAPRFGVTVLGYNYEKVREIAEDLGNRLARTARVGDVDTNASGPGSAHDRAPEHLVRIDRAALARWDMDVGELVGRIQSAIGGSAASEELELGAQRLEYQVRLEGSERVDLLALRETPIQLSGGRRVRLGDLVTVERRDVPAYIVRENQQYQRRVTYEFRGPVELGEAVLGAMLARTELPPGYSLRRSDRFYFSAGERDQFLLILTVSLVLIFMVTAAVFESWTQPFCVLLTVPMGLVGTFLLFFYTKVTFDREAYIGSIVAGGIVVGNAILLVDQLNRMRTPGTLSFDEAVIRGTLQRARPILMTSAVTVLGLAPLVLFNDLDTTVWSALGLTLVGGLLSSTLLVLTVTPALYKLLERGGRKDEGSGGSRRTLTAVAEAGSSSPAGGSRYVIDSVRLQPAP